MLNTPSDMVQSCHLPCKEITSEALYEIPPGIVTRFVDAAETAVFGLVQNVCSVALDLNPNQNVSQPYHFELDSQVHNPVCCLTRYIPVHQCKDPVPTALVTRLLNQAMGSVDKKVIPSVADRTMTSCLCPYHSLVPWDMLRA